MITKVYVTWTDIENFVNTVANLFKDKSITGVYGIPRGGLVLATMLSYKLNIPLLMAPAEDCIIIDDIADSGRTLIHYTSNDTQFNKYKIITYYYHPRSMVLPDLYSKVKEDNTWIVFPWEE